MKSTYYEDLVQEALLTVVKRSLVDVATRGLQGNQHFYISFKTKAVGVSIPGYLAEKYQDEMMIVIQYQYLDLAVTDEYFSVSLSFNGNYEHLQVPFSAVTAFVDPSVKFGLQFSVKNTRKSGPVNDGNGRSYSESTDSGNIINFENLKKK